MEEEEDSGDPNVILFTALGMILLAFFIMLNNMASLDDARTRAALSSLVGTFGMMKGHEISSAGIAGPPTADGEKVEKDEESVDENAPDAIYDLVRQKLSENPMRGIDVAVREDGRVVIRLEEEMAFAVGGHHLSPRYFATLDHVADVIGKVGYPVRVEGHTDPTPPRRGDSNWYLSAARATSVYRYLTVTSAVPRQLITPIGYAATRRVTDAGADRRRVELVFLPPTANGAAVQETRQ